MRPIRHLLALAALVLMLPVAASFAAPNIEGGAQGSRLEGKGAKQDHRGQKGDRQPGKHKPLLLEVIAFLRTQGVSDIDALSEDRRAELSQAFRDAKGQEQMTLRLQVLIGVLVADGITTPAQIETLTEEQRRAIMEAVHEKIEADRPPMLGNGGPQGRPGGGGPQGGRGRPEGPEGGPDRLLDHFAQMLTQADIADISTLTESQIASLVPKPGGRKGGQRPEQGGVGGKGQGQRGPGGQGPLGNRPGKGPREGGGPGGGQRGGPEDGGGPRIDPVGQVLDFLRSQGIESIAGLTDQQIEELQLTWRETMRPPNGGQ